MESVGKLMIGVGLGTAALGLILTFGDRIPGLRLGRLPGDVAINKGGVGFYFPFTTMLLLSALASFLLWLMGRWRR